MAETIPLTQIAVELIGPDKLQLNRNKAVERPNDYQVLCRIEAVSLCFSDLKLLKQFSAHVRKDSVIGGIDLNILKEIPSYKPQNQPTVPGHEAVVRVIEAGKEVRDIKIGSRYLIQPDYRWIKTGGLNAALGYNFEGALQQYVLMDSRIITSPDGQSTLLPAAENLSAASIAIVEPWGCVEQAYAACERRELKKDGRKITADENSDISQIADRSADDLIYFGSDAEIIEKLFGKLADGGILNIVLSGKKLNRQIEVPVGRFHYSRIRIIGTQTSDPADSMKNIPQTGEIRPGDYINVIGAAGPMGVMHVVRNICQDVKNVKVFAGDLDHARLAVLEKIAAPQAEKYNVAFKTYNPKKQPPPAACSYIIIMAPDAETISQAVMNCGENAIINIFAGIAENITAKLDLNRYIEKKLYLTGTSGSTIEDMKTVLDKVQSGRLNTNLSIGAVSGLAGAIDGIRAVENRTIAGKIVVYPQLADMELLSLDELKQKLPFIAKNLDDGFWCKNAEDVLLKKS